MNVTFESREEICQVAYELKSERILVGAVAVQALLSAATVMFFILCIRLRRLQHIFSIINKDLKILILIGTFIYAVGIFNSFLVYAYKLGLLLLNLDKCAYVWQGFRCFWAHNLFSIICVVGYCLFHVSLFIERFYATFSHSKKSCGIVGAILALIVLCCSPMPQVFIYKSSMIDYDRVFCASVTSTTQQNSRYSGYLLIILDYAITVADFILLIFNRHQIKQYKKLANTFDLEHSFHLRELKISIEVIYPFSIVHSFTFCLQFIMGFYVYEPTGKADLVWYYFNGELVNMSRIFATFILIGFLWIYNSWRDKASTVWVQDQKDQKSESDAYFKEFQRIIA